MGEKTNELVEKAVAAAEELPKPTEHELTVKALAVVQRLNGQIHSVTQSLAAGEDASLEKQVIARTRASLNAACEAAGM